MSVGGRSECVEHAALTIFQSASEEHISILEKTLVTERGVGVRGGEKLRHAEKSAAVVDGQGGDDRQQAAAARPGISPGWWRAALSSTVTSIGGRRLIRNRRMDAQAIDKLDAALEVGTDGRKRREFRAQQRRGGAAPRSGWWSVPVGGGGRAPSARRGGRRLRTNADRGGGLGGVQKSTAAAVGCGVFCIVLM